MLLMTMMLIIVKTCGFCCCCSRCYGSCNSVRRRSSHCSHCSLRLSRRAIVSNHVLDNELMMFIYIYFIFAFILYLPTYIYWHCALASTPPGMPGTHPLQYFGWGGTSILWIRFLSSSPFFVLYCIIFSGFLLGSNYGLSLYSPIFRA